MYELFILLIFVVLVCSCIVSYLLVKSINYINKEFKELNEIKNNIFNILKD